MHCPHETESVPHALKFLTEENPQSTVLSIDGTGASDLISRKSILEALITLEGGPAIIPFASSQKARAENKVTL